jgi:hypothetical protein
MSDLSETTSRLQDEATSFRAPISEDIFQKMGGAVNSILSSLLPVGSVMHAMLTEAQFQAQASTKWVLADGRNITGSTYHQVSGFTNVPDLRGVFARGRNFNRDTDFGNSLGDLGVNTYRTDWLQLHTHQLDMPGPATPTYIRETSSVTEGTGTIQKDEGSEYKLVPVTLTNAPLPVSADDETRPRNVTVNIFFKIN